MPEAVVVGTAAAADSAASLVAETEPDLLFLDVFLKRGTGLDVLRSLKFSRTRILVMTDSPSEELERRCLALGAAEFFDKAESGTRVPHIIERALAARETEVWLQDERGISEHGLTEKTQAERKTKL